MSTRSNISPSSALLVFTILPLIFQCLAHDWARHMQRTSTEVTAQPHDSCMHSPNSISQKVSCLFSPNIVQTEERNAYTLTNFQARNRIAATMCYLVVERYSICRCPYYKHSIDMCVRYGAQGHPIQERTLLVGYACERHSQYQEESFLWSSSSESSAARPRRGDSSERILSAKQGIKITSAVALRVLKDAQYGETDDDLSNERADESIMETVSTQTTVDEDPRDEAKPQSMPDHRFEIEDFRSRLRCPTEYVTYLQELRKRVWNNSTISIYKSRKLEEFYLRRLHPVSAHTF